MTSGTVTVGVQSGFLLASLLSCEEDFYEVCSQVIIYIKYLSDSSQAPASPPLPTWHETRWILVAISWGELLRNTHVLCCVLPPDSWWRWTYLCSWSSGVSPRSCNTHIGQSGLQTWLGECLVSVVWWLTRLQLLRSSAWSAGDCESPPTLVRHHGTTAPGLQSPSPASRLLLDNT